jgi:hypothetical protein
MTSVVTDPKLVAYCGLYCGACRAYRKGRCPGCAENEKAGWCKIRACCIENDYTSCAACTQFANVADCKKFDNFLAKVFGFVFRSDRKACIARIKEIGAEAYAAEMAAQGRQSIRRT